MLRKKSPDHDDDTPSAQPKIKISQRAIRPKIRSLLTQLGYSEETIKTFKKGYCTGLTAIALYSFYTEALNLDSSQLMAIDDWAWFKKTLETLSTWDEQLYSLYEEDFHDILHLASLMEFYQHTSSYIAQSQGNLHEILEDTARRRPIQEYNFSGLFTSHDFIKSITVSIGDMEENTSLLNILLKYEKRLIMISRGGHTLGLFRHGGRVSFYNANSGRKDFALENAEKIIATLFSAYHYQPHLSQPFGFRIYTFDSKPEAYPKQDVVLQALNTPNHALDHSAIHLATRIGGIDCMNFYLQEKSALDIPSKSKRTPLYIAASRGYVHLAIELLKQGADILKETKHKLSPLRKAASNGHVGVVKAMLESGNNSTSTNLLIALKHLPSDEHRLKLLTELEEPKLDVMTRNVDSKNVLDAFKNSDKQHQQQLCGFFNKKQDTCRVEAGKTILPPPVSLTVRV